MYALMYRYALKGGGIWCIVCVCVDCVMLRHRVTCTHAQRVQQAASNGRDTATVASSVNSHGGPGPTSYRLLPYTTGPGTSGAASNEHM